MHKKIATLLVAVHVITIFVTPFTAHAGTTSKARKGATQAINNFLKNDVGLTPDDYLAGVGTKKSLIPEVTVLLSNTEGRYHTAIAQVAGITNIEEAHYTWYIKNDEYDRTNILNSDILPRSEHMGPLRTDDCKSQDKTGSQERACATEKMDRYKIAATRAALAANFDVMRFDSEFNDNDLRDGFEDFGNSNGILEENEYPRILAVQPDGTIGEADEDDDGYYAYLGGSNARNGGEDDNVPGRFNDEDNYCYIYDLATGEPHELVGGSITSGFECAGDDVSESDDWTIECIQTVSEETQCATISPGTSITTAADATGGDSASAAADSTAAGGDATAAATVTTASIPSSKNLYSCESHSDARCIYDAGSSRGFCQDGGIPVCVPTSNYTEQTDGSAESAEDNIVINPFTQRVSQSEQCTETSFYTYLFSITNLQQQLAEQAAAGADTEVLAGITNQIIEETALLDNLVLETVSLPGGLPDQAVLDALNADTSSSIDRNSFICTENSIVSGATVTTMIPELEQAPYNFETPSCIASTESNKPDYTDNDLFPSSELTNLCTEEIHLFPFAAQSGLSSDYGFTTGDGEFGIDEEKFWGTNPTNARTVEDSSENDEAFISGQGLIEFTWEYREGDEIGVVVEGIGANATRHDSQHPQTVFAFMENGCSFEYADEVNYYLEEILTRKDVEFKTADMKRDHINLCLLDNFLSPGVITENENLDVSLSGPTNAIPNNQNIPFTISASLSGDNQSIDDNDSLERTLYNWKIYYSEGASDLSGSNVSWTLLLDSSLGESTDEAEQAEYQNKIQALGLQRLKGSGLSELTMLGNFLDGGAALDDALIRVVVDANAPTANAGVSRYGRSEIIFPIISQDRVQLQMNRISSYDTTLGKVVASDFQPICENNQNEGEINPDAYTADSLLCSTIPYEVLAFEIPADTDVKAQNVDGATTGRTNSTQYPPEFISWELDGVRITCDPEVSALCTQRPIVFVPTKDIDTSHTVTAIYTNPSAGAKSTEIFSRSFRVIAPRIHLEPGAGIQQRELGSYTTLEIGSPEQPDLSNTTFKRAGDSFELIAELEPSMLENYTGGTGSTSDTLSERVTLKWTNPEDAESLDEGVLGEPNSRTHTFSVPDYLSEDAVKVGVRAIVSTPAPIRRLLTDRFGFDRYDSSLLIAEAGAVVYDPSALITTYNTSRDYERHYAQKAQNKSFTATVFSSTSSYILFLLKVSLTIGLILFISSLAMNPTRRRI